MRNVILALLLLLSMSSGASAQLSGSGAVYQKPQDAACKTTVVNSVNSGQDITVDSTAGGVVVMGSLSTRCGATILNSGTANMRCAQGTITVTSTVGFLIAAGGSLNLGFEGQQGWKCIRTTGTDTAASVIESRK